MWVPNYSLVPGVRLSIGIAGRAITSLPLQRSQISSRLRRVSGRRNGSLATCKHEVASRMNVGKEEKTGYVESYDAANTQGSLSSVSYLCLGDYDNYWRPDVCLGTHQ